MQLITTLPKTRPAPLAQGFVPQKDIQALWPFWSVLSSSQQRRAWQLLKNLLPLCGVTQKQLRKENWKIPTGFQTNSSEAGKAHDGRRFQHIAQRIGATPQELLISPYVRSGLTTLEWGPLTDFWPSPLYKGLVTINTVAEAREWLKEQRDTPRAFTSISAINHAWLKQGAYTGASKPESLRHLWRTKPLCPWNMEMFLIALRIMCISPEEAWAGMLTTLPRCTPCPRLEAALS